MDEALAGVLAEDERLSMEEVGEVSRAFVESQEVRRVSGIYLVLGAMTGQEGMRAALASCLDIGFRAGVRAAETERLREMTR